MSFCWIFFFLMMVFNMCSTWTITTNKQIKERGVSKLKIVCSFCNFYSCVIISLLSDCMSVCSKSILLLRCLLDARCSLFASSVGRSLESDGTRHSLRKQDRTHNTKKKQLQSLHIIAVSHYSFTQHSFIVDLEKNAPSSPTPLSKYSDEKFSLCSKVEEYYNILENKGNNLKNNWL